jgi:hypothetical protein
MSKPTPTASVERLTPKAATALLERNFHNRNLRKARVASLVEAIQRGEWELNGESIKVASDDTLIDGQHRLQAIAEAGKPVKVLVVRNLPLAAQDTVDTGRRRRLADILMVEGYSDPSALAAAINILHRYRIGVRLDYSQINAPSAAQALALIEAEPHIRESVRTARNVTKQIGGPLGVFSALHHVFFELDPDPAEDFFRRLQTGDELRKGDPLLHLRNQVVRPRKDRGYTQSPHHVAALTIRAFNLRRAGREVEVLLYRANQKFPAVDPPGLLGTADGNSAE